VSEELKYLNSHLIAKREGKLAKREERRNLRSLVASRISNQVRGAQMRAAEDWTAKELRELEELAATNGGKRPYAKTNQDCEPPCRRQCERRGGTAIRGGAGGGKKTYKPSAWCQRCTFSRSRAKISWIANKTKDGLWTKKRKNVKGVPQTANLRQLPCKK